MRGSTFFSQDGSQLHSFLRGSFIGENSSRFARSLRVLMGSVRFSLNKTHVKHSSVCCEELWLDQSLEMFLRCLTILSTTNTPVHFFVCFSMLWVASENTLIGLCCELSITKYISSVTERPLAVFLMYSFVCLFRTASLCLVFMNYSRYIRPL